ncbi:unnamed protein product [Protopolystoma xenopodis]|uniref:Uncharacterized protein n=1 Tax=Protopolystoma xenopodis TaxID=117903 RepID=A0A448XK08_9PLAT|nr:unnamed protein product [Protopolystoma xenopodis]
MFFVSFEEAQAEARQQRALTTNFKAPAAAGAVQHQTGPFKTTGHLNSHPPSQGSGIRTRTRTRTRRLTNRNGAASPLWSVGGQNKNEGGVGEDEGEREGVMPGQQVDSLGYRSNGGFGGGAEWARENGEVAKLIVHVKASLSIQHVDCFRTSLLLSSEPSFPDPVDTPTFLQHTNTVHIRLQQDVRSWSRPIKTQERVIEIVSAHADNREACAKPPLVGLVSARLFGAIKPPLTTYKPTYFQFLRRGDLGMPTHSHLHTTVRLSLWPSHLVGPHAIVASVATENHQHHHHHHHQ